MRQIRDRSMVFERGDDPKQAYWNGIEDVLYIRCADHLGLKQLNVNEAGQGECPICQIINLLTIGAPGHHVLRLVGNGDISAGKGRELLIDVLLGKIGLGDLPVLNAGFPSMPEDETYIPTIRRGRLETARWLAERSWYIATLTGGFTEAVNELFEFFGMR